MHFSLPAVAFIRVLLLWLTFHSTTTSAISLRCHIGLAGKECPAVMRGRPKYDQMIKDKEQWKYPTAVLKAVHQEQLPNLPVENGKPYLFIVSWPGSPLQNVANGGEHIGIIVVQFGETKETTVAEIHDLDTDLCGAKHRFNDYRSIDAESHGKC